jgi:hypothetical protein
MTTGNGGPSSSAQSPGSSPTDTAASVTTESNATGSASTSEPPSSTCADCSTWASPTTPTAGPSPPERGPGADNEGTTPSAISHPARPTHILDIDPRGRTRPPHTHHTTTTRTPAKASVAQRPPSSPRSHAAGSAHATWVANATTSVPNTRPTYQTCVPPRKRRRLTCCQGRLSVLNGVT